jgi:beta-glucosidase
MKRFPPGFAWGAGTAAYQIEGGPDLDGRGESIWDRFIARAGVVERGETAHRACEHYWRYREDVALMKELGLGAYRFSISWPRILPDGRGAVNEKGLDFYRKLVDELLAANIQPWVCLYHWDLPQALEDAGGWPARETAQYFADYASIVAAALGDRVRHFITVNEPWVAAYCGYRWGQHAPGVADERAAFAAAWHLLLAHGLGWDAIKSRSSADVGIANFSFQPLVLNRHAADAGLLEHMQAENNGIFLDPVLKGTYPQRMLDHLKGNAPDIRPGDFALIHRYDFVGVQYYKDQIVNMIPGQRESRYDFLEYTETGWPVTPVGLYDHLVWLHERYQPRRIVVSENGAAFPDVLGPGGVVRDEKRQQYLRAHLSEIHRAVEAGVPVEGYFVWTLMDNFEWVWGYRPRFGIVYTEFASQKRYIKDSGHLYARIIRENGIE